uniref:Uncharacterized protein n=1 Tax=Hyaloperonospora arabidopsidis (strain Emoy2) TaxID=559515 RepID=M4C038_HYAAE
MALPNYCACAAVTTCHNQLKKVTVPVTVARSGIFYTICFDNCGCYRQVKRNDIYLSCFVYLLQLPTIASFVRVMSTNWTAKPTRPLAVA